MPNNAKYLITTSDMLTWKFDRPVLFLSKACLREKDRAIWETMNAEIPQAVGTTGEDRLMLLQLARKIESRLFPRFIKILNEFHGLKHDERYWKILIGHWFRETIDLLVNRTYTITRAIDEYQISGITIHDFPESILAGSNYSTALLKTNDSNWNEQIIFKIITLLGIDIGPIERIVLNNEFKIDKSIAYNVLKSNTKENFYEFCREFAKKLVRKADALIINSYLPLEREFLLSIALRQFPQWWISPTLIDNIEPNERARSFLREKLEELAKNKDEAIASTLLFELIPICYLEGYERLLRLSQELEWPENPKFIFSSNNFVSDDVFKIWTANKVAAGFPYYAGQHGNNYGTNRYLQSSIEEVTSDKFLTWGWKNDLVQHTPAFLFKNVSNPKNGRANKKGIILIEDLLVVRINVWDQAAQFEIYIQEQFKFVLNLELHVREVLSVRLHPAHREMIGDEELLWQKFDEEINLDSGEVPIRRIWNSNRIIVHSYDSTGLLETLEANIPTLAFWQNGLDHLVENAKPYYEILIAAGIVHMNPVSAALKVNEIWDNVESWWLSKEVQSAREAFCSQYARTSKKPIRDLKKILLENI